MAFVMSIDLSDTADYDSLTADLVEAGVTSHRTTSSGSTGMHLAQLLIEGADAVLAPAAAVIAAWITMNVKRTNGSDPADIGELNPIKGRIIFSDGRRLELEGEPDVVLQTLRELASSQKDA